jgi:hypothetical protein
MIMLQNKRAETERQLHPGPNPQSTFLGGTIMSYSEIIINGVSIKLIPLGDCACGCGGKTKIAVKSNTRDGCRKGQPKKYIYGHHKGNWKGGKTICHGYVLIKAKDHPKSKQNGYIFEHILVAEKALGKSLPPGACVHHKDEMQGNNDSSNLVICQDNAYHKFLHRRMRAYKACGHANWRKCKYCKQYDSLDNLSASGHGFVHRRCANIYQNSRRVENNSV